ncbi:MAG: hypothetical protein ACRDP1_04235 [Nocardioidaceae bacterium]
MQNHAMAAAEQTRHLPFSPYIVGLIAFALLAILLFIVLSFGKGRPHS